MQFRFLLGPCCCSGLSVVVAAGLLFIGGAWADGFPCFGAQALGVRASGVTVGWCCLANSL